MRKYLLLAVVLIASVMASAQTYSVTFRVNMNEVAAAFTTPEVNGSFNGWCGGCAQMTDGDADGVWEITIPLDAGTYEYKFAYDSWAGDESLTPGSPCTITTDVFTNRLLTVSEDVVLPVVCWASCEDCTGVVLTQMDLPVTFDEEGVDYGVIGFGGAEASTIEEDPTDNTNTVVKVIKSATAQTWAGTTVTNAANEGLATPIPFTASETLMSVRVWSPDANIPVRLKVEDHTDPTRSVETEAMTTVAGEWETLTFDFSNEATGTAAINLGYSYDKASVFFNFGTSGEMQGEKTYYFDDLMFGGEVVEPMTYNVTFRVDMNNVTESYTTPEVNGTFNGWCGGCAPMSDADADGIWELTIALEEGSYEFKYAYDNWAGSEQLSEDDCTVNNGGFINRVLNVSGDVTLPVVCWASCDACEPVGDLFDVLFRVDMNDVTESFTTPEVNGNFNGWCGGCAPMTDADADGVWELVIQLPAGTYEYKFAYDSWTGQENLTPGSECTLTTGAFTNRVITVSADTELPVVCWASCSACDDPQGPYNVLFRVDMSNVTESYTTPEVNGTFNGWCGGCAPMADPENDDIWELVIALPAGMHEYKFAYDTWAGQESLTEGSACTITTDGFTNRFVEVTGEVDLPVVCWASCEPCEVNVHEMDAAGGLTLYPNPAADVLQAEFSVLQHSSCQVRVTDMRGTVVYTGSLGGVQRFTLDTSAFADGVYTLQVLTENDHYVRSFIVRK